MDKTALISLLRQVKNGEISPDEAAAKLKTAPFEELGYAKVDHHRAIRQGEPEVIFGLGKTPEQIVGIVEALLRQHNTNIIITRMSAEAAALVSDKVALRYDPLSKMGIANPADTARDGCIVIASGGTSDIPVCEEAALTAEAFGNKVVRLYDVGVSGVHRLLHNLDLLTGARVVVAVAGMEGALPSVIGGLVDCPVIAVPTSVGYGASFHGLSALLSMLNSCASGVSVVNIDNGFGAGYMANMINHTEAKR